MCPDNNDCATHKSNELLVVPILLRSVCRIQWRLYLSLVARALLPTIYSSLRLSLLGDLPSDQGVNIASQVLTLCWLSHVMT